MCGIAGFLCPVEAPEDSEQVLRGMLGAIRHRGPDEFGVYIDNRVGLGSARLSIIDLAGGQQPICNEDGSLWIVFNGEIFNYLELRKGLEDRGHTFSTHTDTEVILHLFEERGPECLRALNGQFAIAIWDSRREALFLARDRVGVRPLFYCQNRGSTIFASEVKALRAFPGVSTNIKPQALREVFTYWSTLSSNTCFGGVFELPPGHYLTMDQRGLQVRAWWQLEFEEEQNRSEQEYADELYSLLRDATRLRLRADVPVGAYLSGGLDSSLIAALVRHLGVAKLDTFSISFADSRYDESEYQRQMAKALGTEHQVVYATDEMIGDVFPDVVWHTEAPVLRTAPAPMFLLSKLVRDQRYKVVLTGEGADEFLAGYDVFKEAKIRRFWARQPGSPFRPQLLRKLYPDIAGIREANITYLAAFFGRNLQDVQNPAYSHFIRWQNGQRLCRFLSDDVRNERSIDQPLCPENFASWGALQQAQFLEINVFLSQYLLSSQGDRVAMAHSVEGRYPFLDHRVMEFCNRLPARMKLRALQDKYLLRKVAAAHLPDQIAQRRKRPYRAPIRGCFFSRGSGAYVQEVLSNAALKESGLFKIAAVEQLVRKAKGEAPLGETDEMALVGIISTQLLFRHFVSNFRVVGSPPEREKLKVVDCRKTRALQPAAAFEPYSN